MFGCRYGTGKGIRWLCPNGSNPPPSAKAPYLLGDDWSKSLSRPRSAPLTLPIWWFSLTAPSASAATSC